MALTFRKGSITSCCMVNTKPLTRDVSMTWRLPSADKAAFAAAAEREGVSLAAWLLRLGRAEVERERGKCG